MERFLQRKTRKGYIAIFIVIALLAFSVSVMLTVNYLSIDQSQVAFALTQGERALQLTHGCAENALLLARRDETYTGGSTPLLGGTCEVALEKNGSTWTFTVTGNENDFSRTLIIMAEYTAGDPAILTPTSWLEQ